LYGSTRGRRVRERAGRGGAGGRSARQQKEPEQSRQALLNGINLKEHPWQEQRMARRDLSHPGGS
jgi:hypothetical protein